MGNPKILKRILAGVLAAMIGLSALGSLVMAFAAQPEPDISLPEPVSGGTVYVAPDEDWELLVLEKNSDTVQVELGDRATMTLTSGCATSLWLGWGEQYNNTLWELAERYSANFDVVDFVFTSTLEQPVAMTITTPKPYLYRVDRGELVEVHSSYTDGVHSFTTQVLDCFVASDAKPAL